MSKKQTKRAVIIAVIVVLLAGTFFVNKYVLNHSDIPDDPQIAKMAAGPSAPARAIPVMVAIADIEEISEGTGANGVLLANEEVELTSEVAGKVTRIEFNEGSVVSKGQLLVKLNDDDLQAQLKRLKFQEVTLAEKLERQRILFEKEAISREAYDQVQTEYNMLLADIELINVRIDKTEIRAPFSGVIGFRYISEGSYLQPGGRIARLVDINTLKMEFAIPEKYNDMDLVGRKIYFTAVNEDLKREARIYAMEPKYDEDTRTIIMRAVYSNSDRKLRPGMSTWIDLTAGNEKGLMVPTEAIVSSISGMNVWLVRDGAPVQVPVTTGLRTPRKVEILEGVQTGDSVIITGLMQLRPDSKITITN